MKSSLFTLNKADFVKGLVIAVLTGIITAAYSTIQSGSVQFDWKAITIAALSAAFAYITKNLLTNSNDEFLKKDPS
jgi:hypothetical protein